ADFARRGSESRPLPGSAAPCPDGRPPQLGSGEATSPAGPARTLVLVSRASRRWPSPRCNLTANASSTSATPFTTGRLSGVPNWPVLGVPRGEVLADAGQRDRGERRWIGEAGVAEHREARGLTNRGAGDGENGEGGQGSG